MFLLFFFLFSPFILVSVLTVALLAYGNQFLSNEKIAAKPSIQKILQITFWVSSVISVYILCGEFSEWEFLLDPFESISLLGGFWYAQGLMGILLPFSLWCGVKRYRVSEKGT